MIKETILSRKVVAMASALIKDRQILAQQVLVTLKEESKYKNKKILCNQIHSTIQVVEGIKLHNLMKEINNFA